VAGFYLTEDARADLVNIALYTFEHWGGDQERDYIAALYTRFATIAEKPTRGKPSDDILPGLRRIRQGSHVVYFRMVGEEVEIARVLHKRMLPENHFLE
jgi:toxin ParE1/3/4